jgi:MFS family permease
MKEAKTRANRALIGCILLVSMNFGTFIVLSNYIGGLSVQFSATVGQIILLFSISSIGSLIANLSLAPMFRRMRIRSILLIGISCYAAFFLLMAFSTSLPLLYVAALLFGMGVAGCGFVVAQAVIMWWFVRGVGKKISYPSIAYPLVSLALSPAIAWGIQSVGFTPTLVVHGLVCVAVMLFAALALIPERPEFYGLTAYDPTPGTRLDASSAGVREAIREASETGAEALSNSVVNMPSVESPAGMTLKQALRTPSYWLVSIAVFLIVGVATGFGGQAVVIFETAGGVTAMAAALILSVKNLAAMAWNFAYGALADRVGGSSAGLVFGLGVMVFSSIAVFVSGTGGAIFIAASLAITQFGGMYAAMILPRMFGLKEFGSILASINVSAALGGAVVGALGGFIYDATLSYTIYFIFFAAAAAAMVVLQVMATRPRAVNRLAETAAAEPIEERITA